LLSATYTSPLGSSAQLRADMVKYLGPFIGDAKATGVYDSIMGAIKEEAGMGAKSKVMPILIGGLAVSGLIAAVGVGMIVSAKRRK
jgi:hypothetical protein